MHIIPAQIIKANVNNSICDHSISSFWTNMNCAGKKFIGGLFNWTSK